MSILPKEIIKTQNFKSVNDIHFFLKDIMKDFIQESLEIELDIPRDRNTEFEPHIVPKYSRDISNLEKKIISMCGFGIVTRDISKYINEIYGIDILAETIIKITDKFIPSIEKWKTRILEDIYYFVFLDIHFSVKEDKSTVKKAAYVVLAVDQEEKKDILGIYIEANGSSKFWLIVLNDLKRGIKDILITCVDGLTGFKEAIQAVYPQTDIQRYIVHQIRYTLTYVNYKDKKKFSKDLKIIYTAPNEETSYLALQEVKENKKRNNHIY